MAQIPQEKIDEIINKADIVSVIGKYTNLQKKGREYVGLCLFHDDQSPSMMVSPDKKIFKCFSCGVGGDVIGFLMKYQHISFVKAAVELAKEFNVDLGDFKINEKPETEEEKYKKVLYEVNEAAMTYYQAVLNSKLGIDAKNYLAKRQITKDELVRWNIGYAPGNNSLVKYFENLKIKVKDKDGNEKEAPKYSAKNLLDAGVVNQDDNGELRDFHNKRIVFPIRNKEGYVTGFSGRVMDDSKPKYVNSRESQIFKKSDILFNIDDVWKNKARYKNLLVLEGFMDVIALNRVEHQNAVALMGTSVSDFHINVFKELKLPIKLFLDGDVPGQNAMYKNAPKFIQNKVPFTIVDNTTIHDPDELVAAGQLSDLNKMIDRSKNVYEYFIEKWIDGKELNVDQKKEYVDKLFYLLQYEPDVLAISAIIKELSNKLGFDIELLKQQFDNYKASGHRDNYVAEKPVVQKTTINRKANPKEVFKNKWNNVPTATQDRYARVFLSVLKSSDYTEKIYDELPTIYTGQINWQKLLKTIINYYRSGEYEGNDSVKLIKLLESEADDNLKYYGENFEALYDTEVTIDSNTNPVTEKELGDIIYSSRIDNLNADIDNIMKKVKDLDKQIDEAPDEKSKQELQDQVWIKYAEKRTIEKQITKLRNKKNELDSKGNK